MRTLTYKRRTYSEDDFADARAIVSFDEMVRHLKRLKYDWMVCGKNYGAKVDRKSYGYTAWISDPARVTKSGNRRPWYGDHAATPELALWSAYAKIDGS